MAMTVSEYQFLSSLDFDIFAEDFVQPHAVRHSVAPRRQTILFRLNVIVTGAILFCFLLSRIKKWFEAPQDTTEKASDSNKNPNKSKHSKGKYDK